MYRKMISAAAALVFACFLSGPSGAQEAAAQAQPPDSCNPEVREALEKSAERGVMEELFVIRHPEQGIRDPMSLLDFSCVEDLFNYRTFNIHFDPNRAIEELMGMLQRKICTASRDAYRDFIGRPLDATVLLRDVPRLPGLSFPRDRGNVIDEGRRRGAESFKGIVGGSQ